MFAHCDLFFQRETTSDAEVQAELNAVQAVNGGACQQTCYEVELLKSRVVSTRSCVGACGVEGCQERMRVQKMSIDVRQETWLR